MVEITIVTIPAGEVRLCGLGRFRQLGELGAVEPGDGGSRVVNVDAETGRQRLCVRPAEHVDQGIACGSIARGLVGHGLVEPCGIHHVTLGAGDRRHGEKRERH